MSRLASNIQSLMNPTTVVVSFEAEDIQKRLDRCFIVLEALQELADESGVYTSGSGKSDIALSPELKGKALKWAHAADDLSEGETDNRTDDITDAVSWESISISMEANVITLIVVGIAKAIAAIFKFIGQLLFGHKAKAERMNTEYSRYESNFDKEWEEQKRQREKQRQENTKNWERAHQERKDQWERTNQENSERWKQESRDRWNQSSGSHSSTGSTGERASGYTGSGPSIVVSQHIVESLSTTGKLEHLGDVVTSLTEVATVLNNVDEFYRRATPGIFHDMLASVEKVAENDRNNKKSDEHEPHYNDILLTMKKSMSELATACTIQGFNVDNYAKDGSTGGRAESKKYPGLKVFKAQRSAGSTDTERLGHTRIELSKDDSRTQDERNRGTRVGIDKDTAKRVLTYGGKVSRAYQTITELAIPIEKLKEQALKTINEIQEKPFAMGNDSNEKMIREALRPVHLHLAMNMRFIAQILMYADTTAKAALTLAKDCKQAA